jgi:hypothetical protein
LIVLAFVIPLVAFGGTAAFVPQFSLLLSAMVTTALPFAAISRFLVVMLPFQGAN